MHQFKTASRTLELHPRIIALAEAEFKRNPDVTAHEMAGMFGVSDMYGELYLEAAKRGNHA